LYTFAGKRTILLLTGFIKKSKAIPPREIKKARALKKDYLERKKGDKNG
jgi:phage-related protein